MKYRGFGGTPGSRYFFVAYVAAVFSFLWGYGQKGACALEREKPLTVWSNDVKLS